MGDCQNGELWVDFGRRLKLEFFGSKVTADAEFLAYREFDETLGLTEMGKKAVGIFTPRPERPTRPLALAAAADLKPSGRL